MPYFNSKNRTVFSPKNELLEPFYKMLEQYEATIGGSHLYDDLIEQYEYLEFVFKEDQETE